jgi:hypothetical protein
VTDVEWFLLVDEGTRNGKAKDNATTIGGGWQSGLLTAGGAGVSTQKVGYSQDAGLFAQGRAACTAGMVNWTPQTSSSSSTTTGGKATKANKHKSKSHSKSKTGSKSKSKPAGTGSGSSKHPKPPKPHRL